MEGDKRTEIRDISSFHHPTGQTICLRAYPHVKQPSIPSVKEKLQAYRGQDHHDPTCTYARGTRREGQQAMAAEQEAQVAQCAQDVDANPAQALNLQWYAGENLIQRQDQPWAWNMDRGTNHNALEMCDHYGSYV